MMTEYDIFDPSNSLTDEPIVIYGFKTHAEALEAYIGNKKFVRTLDPRGGDYAVKKKYGNRLWFNKT